jgi:hypothetical protein
MQFTPQEKKWIERLRKDERQWPGLRWFTLGAGIFGVLCYSFILIMVFNFPGLSSDSQDVTVFLLWLSVFAMLWPKCLIGFIFGAWLVVWTIINWHGNANRILLLRLLDANQKQADAEKHPDSHE